MSSHHPTTPSNHLTNIALVGPTGRIGSQILTSLLTTPNHTLTALTRSSSPSLPSSILQKQISYDHPSTLVSALRGQDVLIITLSPHAPRETQKILIDAAIEAEVPWIIPNEWGGDHYSPSVARDTLIGEGILSTREYIRQQGKGKTRFVALACGFWYEFSLAGTEARYGFDFDQKKVTFYDDGKRKISTSTFARVGEAVAKLVGLKVWPEEGDNKKEPYFGMYADGMCHVSSFQVSQREMFESVLRVTGDEEKDWNVSYEPVEERYKRGKAMMEKGEMVGFGILLYARMFYADGCGDFGDKVQNGLLGLEEEDLDEATKRAVEMAARGETNAMH